MSNDQQPNEQKAPTFWYVLGVAWIGGLIESILFVVFLGVFYRSVEIISIKAVTNCLRYTILPSIIGAAVGVLVPREITKKWEGLWKGTVLGSAISFCLLVVFVIFLAK